MLVKVQRFISKHAMLLFVAAACIVSVYYGAERVQNVDFVCTNGDYQNYNVLRRVLAGQTPYRDFANYLGMGPLVLCAPLLAFHNTFAGSLFVTRFVADVAFILLTALVLYLVTGKRLISAFGGILLPKLLSAQILMNVPYYGYYISYYFGMLDKPNNSFRIVRMFLPVLFCAIGLLVVRTMRKKDSLPPPPPEGVLRETFGSLRGAAVLGLAIGFGVTWSNDFGFACIGSATLILLILAIADGVRDRCWGRSFFRFAGYVPALLVGMLLSALFAARGDLKSYFTFTKDVAQWQFWYYGIHPWDKIFSLPQLVAELRPRTWFHLGIYAASMGYCLWRLCRNKVSDRLLLFVFLYTSIVAGQFVYILGGGADGFEEGHYVFVLLLAGGLLLKALCALAGRLGAGRMLHMTTAVLAVSYVMFMSAETLLIVRENQEIRQTQKKSENYVAQLDGAFTEKENAVALKEMYAVVGEESLFSTYATALDDMRGTFQPTGNDYVIHALGDKRFAEYVNAFKRGHYSFVQTTNYKKWAWEPWVAGVSWDLYKEIYSNYSLQGDYSFWSLWEWKGEDANVLNADVELSVKQLDAHRVELTVQSDEKQPCYVDVSVSWNNAFQKNVYRLFTWQNAVFVWDASQKGRRYGVGEGHYLPATGTDRHLMIYMEDGKGRIILEGLPTACTELSVQKATYEEAIAFVR